MATTNIFKIESIFTAKDRLSRPVRKMGAALGRFNQKATSNMAAVSGTFDGMVSTFRSGALVVTGAAAAIGFALVDAAKVGATFEQSITNAVAKFPGEIKRGTDAFKDLEDAAKHVGKTTEFTASQSAEAINFLAAAGFNAKQSIAALPGVVDLATASQTDLAFATDVATDSLSAFGLMTEDTAQLTKNLDRVNDVFAKTVTSSNTTMETLFETVSGGAAVFKAAGFDLETFAALSGALGSAGIKGSKAGTSLKNMAIRLANPVGLAAKQLGRLGVRTKDANGDMVDIIDVIGQIEKGFNKFNLGKGDRLANLSEIFGKIAAPGIATLIDRGAVSLRSYREEMFKAGGAAKKMAEIQRNTVAGSFKTLLSSVESIKIDLFGDKRAQLKQDLDDFTTWVRVNSPEIRAELGLLADVFRDIVQSAGKAFKFVRQFRKEGGSVALGFTRSQAERDAAAKAFALTNPKRVREEKAVLRFDHGDPLKAKGSLSRAEAQSIFDEMEVDPFFSPQSKDGQSAIIGNGTTTKSESTTTTKIILEAAPGTKATIEGEDNPAVQMAPTGGL